MEERKSSINGKIRVLKTLGLGTYIQVEGLTQSGGVVEGIWRSTLKKVTSIKYQVSNCLILGLGGGSAAKWVRHYYPESKIVGIDIDPVMVELGKKYLGLDKLNIDIKIEDALEFLNHKSKFLNLKYNLILIDIYQGSDIPEKFQTEKFIELIKKFLSVKGIAMFNRLYFDEKRKEAMRFAKKLESIFSEVDYYYPEANVMFFCKN